MASPSGTDLRLVPAGENQLDLVADGRGGLAVTSGPDEIVQALTLRLLVRRGELASLGWPDVGSRLHELVGEPDVPRTRLRLAAYVREALLADPRVVEVPSVDVVTDQVEARVQAQVVLTDESTFSVAVAVPVDAP